MRQTVWGKSIDAVRHNPYSFRFSKFYLQNANENKYLKFFKMSQNYILDEIMKILKLYILQ